MKWNPKCTVAFTHSSRFPEGPMWFVELLPKGYGPSLQDKFVCAFPCVEHLHKDCDLRDNRPPEIEVVVKALDDYYSRLEPQAIRALLEEFLP